jgi:hypothetical protein
MRCTTTTTHSDKCLTRPPMDHYKRLLEEACPNHAYPVSHKLKDCGMMRRFMTLGSLAYGTELDEGLDVSDTTLLPGENAVMTVYGGCPPSGRHRMSSQSPRTPTHCGCRYGDLGV